MPPAVFEPANSASARPQTNAFTARPLGSAYPAFSRHKIPFENQFYSATVRQLKMFVRQMCTVRIRRTKDGSGRFQWPRGLRRRYTAVCLLRLWVRIPPRAWTFVCCECCVLSGRGLCDELITRPEESYRLWCVVV